MTVPAVLRRAAPVLLAAGAVLLAAAVVWPTQHLVSRGARGSERLVDIWFSGRVQGVTESVSAAVDGSAGIVALVSAALVLLLASATVWVLTGSRRPAAGAARSATRGPFVVSVALAAAAVVGLSVAFARSGPAPFGWVAFGELGALEFETTPVAFFVPAAGALTALAVVAMVVARRRVAV